MRNTILALLGIALVATLSGCFEMTEVMTINPDGSGKVVFDDFVAPMPQMGDENAKKPDTAAMAKSALKSMIDGSKGVDAWADLTCEVASDGRVHMKGIAYFPDVTKLELGDVKASSVKWAKNDKGGMTLEMANESKKPAASKPAAMTDAQVAEAVKTSKAQYQQNKPMMAAILGNMKIDTTYMLPGKLDEVVGFTKTDKGGVQLVFEGKKMLEAMDKIMADDKALTESVKAGTDPVKDGPGDKALMVAMYGKDISAFKATVAGDLKPLFDYKAEMEKAKAAQADMIKGLKLDEAKAPAIKVTPNTDKN